ncbi:MAG: tetratricopeptide repeat protein [Magnetococcales bacterium]|nr:tetratricopeptide repeat protein [Magnetococcales bacterium]
MTGQRMESLASLRTALETSPDQGHHWLRYMEGLMRSGQAEAALEVLAQGRALGLQGRDVERLATRLRQNAHAHSRLIALFNQGVYGQAESLARGMTLESPGAVVGWKVLGLVLMQRQRFAEAMAPLQTALALVENDAELHVNLGLALHRQGRLDEAESCYRRALEIRPEFLEAWSNLGAALQSQERPEEAERCFRRVLEIDGELPAAHNNLGVHLDERERLIEAETCYRRALALKPDYAAAHSNLGKTLKKQGRYADAEISHRRALALDPELSDSLEEAYSCAMLNGNWRHLSGDIGAIYQAVARGVPLQPFPLLALNDDGSFQRQVSATHVAASLKAILDTPPLVDPAWHPSRRRLRIGYLSADFRDHPITQLLAAVIEAHDRERFVVHCYAYGPDAQDAGRQRIVQASDVFRDLRLLSDLESARRISDDGIDILLELTAFTRHFRPRIAAYRPAPILVNFGFPGTMGHPRLADYKITDPIASPLHAAAHFTETLACLSHCIQPNDRNRQVGVTPTRLAAGLPPDGFVFCSFNQPFKINPELFSIWCRLLNAVPGSVLWLASTSPGAVGHLRQEAMNRGVEPGRLIFAPWTRTLADHLGRLKLADLALDTFPFNSHTTASDALWSGVPLLTKLGNTFVSRIAASLLHAVGLPELVTQTGEAYHELAVELARDPESLRMLRNRLWENRLTHPLFDTGIFTRDLERIFERMWRDHGLGKKAMIVLEGTA